MIISQANGYAADRVNKAKGDTARFNAVLSEYEKEKDITSMRLYIETMDEILSTNQDKITLIDRNIEGYLPVQRIGGGV